MYNLRQWWNSLVSDGERAYRTFTSIEADTKHRRDMSRAEVIAKYGQPINRCKPKHKQVVHAKWFPWAFDDTAGGGLLWVDEDCTCPLDEDHQ